MRIEEALATKLRATAGVTAAVGTRIYPQVAPQGMTETYVVYETVGERGEHTHSGAGGLWRTRVSYACHAATYAAAVAAALAVRAALDGFRGVQSGVTFGSVLSEELVNLYDEVLRMHVVVADFQVMYTG